MAQLNSEDFKNLTDVTHDLSRSVVSSGRNLTFLEKANAQAAAAAKSNEELQKSITAATKNTISGLTAFSSQMANTSANDWSLLNKTIDIASNIIGKLGSVLATTFLGPIAGPIVGGLFSGVANAAGQVAKFLTGQFAAAYGNFEKLSDTGVVATFDDLNSTAIQTGLNYGDIQRSFEKYGVTLARFGGTALKGRVEFNRIAYASKDMSNQFQLLGLSAREVAEGQLSYINQEQFSGAINSMSEKQLQEGSKNYILQLDQLSRLTGVSRAELQKDMDDKTRNARYLAGIADLAPEVRARINATVARLKVLNPEAAEAYQDIAASGQLNTDKARSLAVMNPGILDDINKLKAPGGSADEAIYSLMQAGTVFSAENKETIKFVGSAGTAFKFSTLSFDLASKSQKDILTGSKLTEAQQRDILNGTEKENSDLAKTRRRMYEIGTNISVLSTSSDLATTGLSLMSKGLLKVIRVLNTTFDIKNSKLTDLQIGIFDKEEEIRKKNAAIKLSRSKLRNSGIGPNERQLEQESTDKNEKDVQALNAEILRLKAQTALELSQRYGNSSSISSANRPGSGGGGVSSALATSYNARIAAGESGTAGYDAIYGFGGAGGDPSIPASHNGRNLSQLSIGEALKIAESRMSRNAGAMGKYQFMPSTLKYLMTSAGLTNSDQFNSENQEKLQQAFIASNAATLRRMGIAPTEVNLALAHAVGAGGAAKLLNPANANSNAADVLGLTGAGKTTNPQLNKSVSQYLEDYNKRFSRIAPGARVGGIFKGPTTGYLVTLHGEEMVTPLDNKPTTSINVNDISQNETESATSELISFFETMDDSFDDMIESMNTQSNTRMIARVSGK